MKDGWSYITKQTVPYKNMVIATPPGIIEKEGEIYSRLFLKEDEFESGGYIFRFHQSMEKTKIKRKEKNILEVSNEGSKSI